MYRVSSGIAVLILVFFGTFVPITGVMAESAPPIAWISQFGTGSGTSALGVAIDGSDSVYVVGDTFGALPGQTSAGDYDAFLCKFDILGNVLWSNQYGSSEGDIARGVAVDPSGNIIVSGDTDTALFGRFLPGAMMPIYASMTTTEMCYGHTSSAHPWMIGVIV